MSGRGAVNQAAGLDPAAKTHFMDFSRDLPSFGRSAAGGDTETKASLGLGGELKAAEKDVSFGLGNSRAGFSFAAQETSLLSDGLEAVGPEDGLKYSAGKVSGSRKTGAEDSYGLGVGDASLEVGKNADGRFIRGGYGEHSGGLQSTGTGAKASYAHGEEGDHDIEASLGFDRAKGELTAAGTYKDESTHKGLAAEAHLGSVRAAGRAGEISHSELSVEDAQAVMSRDGVKASVKDVNTGLSVKDAQAAVGVGGLTAGARVGEATMQQGVKNAQASADLSHVAASAESVESTNKFTDVAAAVSGPGKASVTGSASELSLPSYSAKDVAARVDRSGANLTAAASLRDASFQEFSAKDLEASAAVGDKSLGVGARDVSVGRGHADRAAATVDVGAGKANASVDGAAYDAVDLTGGQVGLKSGGQTVAGLKTDLHAGAKADHADAAVDARHLRASGSVQNLQAGVQTGNTSVNLMGHEMALPSMGASLKASGSGSVDVMKGQAQGALDLSGSSVNLAGHELALPSFAKAEGALDLGQGAASGKIGGAYGIGGDVNLAKGELGVSAFGRRIDVAGGLKTAASYLNPFSYF
jgi:hypothetical protein